MHIPYIMGKSKFELLDRSLLARKNIQKTLRDNLSKASNRMKQMAHQKRKDREFDLGDMVYVKLKPYEQASVTIRECHKLAAKYFGPYKVIEKVGKVAYRLELPTTAKIHNVFAIFLSLRKR